MHAIYQHFLSSQTLSMRPQSVLYACFLLMLSIGLLNPNNTMQLLAILLSTMLWLGCCRPSMQLIKIISIWSVILLMPIMLIRFGQHIASGQSFDSVTTLMLLAIPLKAYCLMLVTISCAAYLKTGNMQIALSSLLLPTSIRLILIQITHQLFTLLAETGNIIRHIQLRAAGLGFKQKLSLLFHFPQLWLLRIMQRAENKSAFMELRGYSLEVFHRQQKDITIKDALFICFFIVIFLINLAIKLRAGS